MAATQIQNPETAPMPDRRGQVPADGAPADGAPGSGAFAGGEAGGGALAGGAPADRAPAGRIPGGLASVDRRPDLAGTLRPLAIDIGIPLGTYYLLRDAFGVSCGSPWR
jgi:hypothetical protein